MMRLTILLFCVLAGSETLYVQVGDTQSSASTISPLSLEANLGDEIRFQFNIPSQSVTSGYNCRKAPLPLPQFDSGIRPAGSEFVLNVSTANGFVRGNTYQYFSASCVATGVDLNGAIFVSPTDTETTTIGLAIGLSGGMFLICIVFIIVANFFMRHKYKFN